MDRNNAEADEKPGAAIKRRLPRLGYTDINFLARIIKRGCPTAPYLSDMRREPPGASTERGRWKALPWHR